MRVLVTGAKGKVGSATVEALQAAGHEVTATDVVRGVFERPAAEDAIVLAVESKLPSHEVLRRDRRTTSGR